LDNCDGYILARRTSNDKPLPEVEELPLEWDMSQKWKRTQAEILFGAFDGTDEKRLKHATLGVTWRNGREGEGEARHSM